MKAVQLHGYGDVDQLHCEDVPTPEPGSDEVQVKVMAISLNPVDWKIREGFMKAVLPLQFPVILGRDVSGEVTAVGSNAGSMKVGDKVFGMVNFTYAEYLVEKPENLAILPDGLDPERAAAYPVVTLTGAQIIERGVQAKPGMTILVTGAVGGVGRSAVHVAKKHGATVIAGVRAKQKAEAEGLGADRVVAIDDDGEIARLKDLDAIADTVGGDTIAKLIPAVKKSGVVASVLGKPKGADEAAIRVAEIYSQPDSPRLRQLGEDLARGEFTIPIAARFRLSEMREAQRFAQHGNPGGKVLILP